MIQQSISHEMAADLPFELINYLTSTTQCLYNTKQRQGCDYGTVHQLMDILYVQKYGTPYSAVSVTALCYSRHKSAVMCFHFLR